ncbi:MAG: hypothetical protein LQ340_005640 [Diploschistes diacapsis]|nr:MAG: hypothetical protein LQ340_005640 [Diploschistes diacapsis]
MESPRMSVHTMLQDSVYHGGTNGQSAYSDRQAHRDLTDSLESDHPNARLQKSQPEEKGAFGKSSRRFGSSRATRTQTPAKKENPTIDGFEAALKFDATRKGDEDPSSRPQQASDTTQQPPASASKEPLQVMLFGFSPETQWAAIDFYERVSGGIICEDYSRDPPAERRRYQGYSSNGSIPRRALASAELALSSQYHGGACWIAVTFDSHESGERAVNSSPHLLQGHWVYAEPYRGAGPTDDAPIPGREEDRQANQLGPPCPPQKSATLGTHSGLRRDESPVTRASTLPRNYASPAAQTLQGHADSSGSQTSTTASSATALAFSSASPSTSTTTSSSTLRQRNANPRDPSSSSQEPSKAVAPRTNFMHFPNVPRSTIKPAAEALLPQPSWWEGFVKGLTARGWIPGDMIGSSVPRREDGGFDWERASVYWRVAAWLDGVLGTDLCGLREEVVVTG